MISSQTDLIIQ